MPCSDYPDLLAGEHRGSLAPALRRALHGLGPSMQELGRWVSQPVGRDWG